MSETEESATPWSVLLLREPPMRRGKLMRLREAELPDEAGYGDDVAAVLLSTRYTTREQAIAAALGIEGHLKTVDPASKWTIWPREYTSS